MAEVDPVSDAFAPDDDDIAALLWIPIAEWPAVIAGITYDDLTARGARPAAGGEIRPEAWITVPRTESLRVLVPLLAGWREVEP